MLTLILTFALAQDLESSCRSQAKIAAKESYRTCMSEKKSAQLNELKAAYEQKLSALKTQYERELSQMGGKKPNKKTNQSTAQVESQVRIEIPEGSEQSMEIPEPVPLE